MRACRKQRLGNLITLLKYHGTGEPKKTRNTVRNNAGPKNQRKFFKKIEKKKRIGGHKENKKHYKVSEFLHESHESKAQNQTLKM